MNYNRLLNYFTCNSFGFPSQKLALFVLLFSFALNSPAISHDRDSKKKYKSSISISKINNMVFGALFSGQTSGKVIIATNSGRTKTGGVTLVNIHTLQPLAALFRAKVTITEDDDEHDDGGCHDDDGHGYYDDDDDRYYSGSTSTTSYQIYYILPSYTYLRRVGGYETMVVNSFTKSVSGYDVKVGASLNVNARQRTGTYQGEFYVTAILE